MTRFISTAIRILIIATVTVKSAAAESASEPPTPADPHETLVASCQRGAFVACIEAADLLVLEDGHTGKEEQALEMYLRACGAGLPRGCQGAGEVRRSAKSARIRSEALARELFDRAAGDYAKRCAANVPSGCAALVDMLDSRQLAADEYPRAEFAGKARAIYKEQCESGNGESCAGLADFCDRQHDDACVLRYRDEGCERKHAASCCFLGYQFRGGGHGVVRDGKRALDYFERGCASGEAACCLASAEQYEKGWGTRKDLQRAAARYEDACGGGVASGCVRLARMLRMGRGVRRDLSRAEELLKAACESGMRSACEALREE